MKIIYSVVGLLALANPHWVNASSDIRQQLTDIVVKADNVKLSVQIDLAGRQRMLIQKMTKETLLYALGVDTDKSRASLQKTMAIFDKVLLGLEKGDVSLKLVHTKDKNILAQLQKVKILWGNMMPALNAVARGDVSIEVLKQIASINMPLLKVMNEAVGMYQTLSGQKASQLSLKINLAGKERMLTQKMTKEYLLIALDINAAENFTNLKETMDRFDKVLKGLLHGDKKLGLQAVKDKTARKQLELVEKLWKDFSGKLMMPAEKAILKRIASDNLKLLREMDKAVKMIYN